MNLLEIIQTVCDELGLSAPASVTGARDPTTRQILALVNRAGDELYQTYEWTVSQVEHIVNVAPPIITTGDLSAGSDIVMNVPSTAGIESDLWATSGDGIPVSARVAEVIDATSLRLTEPATADIVQAALTFAKDTYAVPPDFSWFINRTMWDRTNRWELIGPVSPQMDQWQRSGVVTTGPRRRWRQIGLPPNCWRLWPPPTAPSDYPGTLVYEYNSGWWARDDGGAPKARMSIDTDYPVISDQALILSTKWRLWQAKGFDYAAFQQEYLDYVSRLAGRDGGSPDLSLSGNLSNRLLLDAWNVQDGNFPSGPFNLGD